MENGFIDGYQVYQLQTCFLLCLTKTITLKIQILKKLKYLFLIFVISRNNGNCKANKGNLY